MHENTTRPCMSTHHVRECSQNTCMHVYTLGACMCTHVNACAHITRMHALTTRACMWTQHVPACAHKTCMHVHTTRASMCTHHVRECAHNTCMHVNTTRACMCTQYVHVPHSMIKHSHGVAWSCNNVQHLVKNGPIIQQQRCLVNYNI